MRIQDEERREWESAQGAGPRAEVTRLLPRTPTLPPASGLQQYKMSSTDCDLSRNPTPPRPPSLLYLGFSGVSLWQ